MDELPLNEQAADFYVLRNDKYQFIRAERLKRFEGFENADIDLLGLDFQTVLEDPLLELMLNLRKATQLGTHSIYITRVAYGYDLVIGLPLHSPDWMLCIAIPILNARVKEFEKLIGEIPDLFLPQSS